MEWLDHDLWLRVKTGPIGGCWEHMNRGSGDLGHVQVGPRGARVYAHRVAYALANGPIPPGLFVMHTCDNPPCCNPAHLRVGTLADNNKDRAAKGRSALGERAGTAKLTAQQVVDARAAVVSGRGIRAVARSLGVDHTTIIDLVRGTTWRSVQHATCDTKEPTP